MGCAGAKQRPRQNYGGGYANQGYNQGYGQQGKGQYSQEFINQQQQAMQYYNQQNQQQQVQRQGSYDRRQQQQQYNPHASATYGGVVQRGDGGGGFAPPAGQRASRNQNQGYGGNQGTYGSGVVGGSGGYVLDPQRSWNDLSPEEKRLRALAAAENRAVENGTRGGVSQAKAIELSEAAVKADLIGTTASGLWNLIFI